MPLQDCGSTKIMDRSNVLEIPMETLHNIKPASNSGSQEKLKPSHRGLGGWGLACHRKLSLQ